MFRGKRKEARTLYSNRIRKAAVCFIISMMMLAMPVRYGVYASDSEEFLYNGNIYYQINDRDEIVITRARATVEEAHIPEEIDGMPVTEISVSAFQGKGRLKSVIVPSTVHTIGDYAFYQCKTLAEVEIPESVTYIGKKILKETPWFESQPDGCVIAGNNIVIGFRGDSSEVIIPDGTTAIAGGAFEACTSIMSVKIPSTVREIGGLAFSGCEKLTECVIPEGVETIGEYAFHWCSALQKVEIADSVTSIGNHAFAWCPSLISVKLPSGINRIEIAVFSECSSLAKIQLPSSVTEIGSLAFYGCISLKEFSVRSNVTTIGVDAFGGCSSLYKLSVYNGTCRIADSSDTIASGAVIYGFRESTAQVYAQSYERQFVVVSYIAGDINEDGVINISDAIAVLSIYAGMGSGIIKEPSDLEQLTGDMNKDGVLDIADATKILEQYAEHGAGL